MSEKICAITGASGYVGSVVARWFANQGWKVFALTRGDNSGLYPQIPFSLDSMLEPKVFEANGIRTLIHCAYDFRPVDWSSIRRTNVEGSTRLLQSAKQGGVRKIIFISSISAFAGCASLYGKAKLEIEAVVAKVGGTIVRPGLIYGNTVSGGMFGALRSQVLTRKVIPLLGSGEYPQYLLHEDDLCLLLESIADDRLSLTEGPLVAASIRPWPLKTLLLYLAQQEHKQIRLIRVPWRLAWMSIKFLEALGLHPKFRSDSIISLVHQDPSPSFAAEANVGFSSRSLA